MGGDFALERFPAAEDQREYTGRMYEVGELVLNTENQWMVLPPERCGNGHPLAGRCIVGTLACSCGDRHLTWCCDVCEHTTYGPALGPDCSVMNGPARVR